MVRVRCSTAGGEDQIVTCNNTVHVAATDTSGALGSDAAGAHGADTAAGTGLAESTMGSLIFDSLLPGVSADLVCSFQQRIGGSFHLFDSRCECPILQSFFLLIDILNRYAERVPAHSVSIIFYSYNQRKSMEISPCFPYFFHPPPGDIVKISIRRNII
jgi:hypothetical protein